MTSVSYFRAWYHCSIADSETLSDMLFAKGVWSVTAHADSDTNTRLEVISDLDIDHSDAHSVETVIDQNWLTAATCTQSESLLIGQFEIIPVGQRPQHPDKKPLYINPDGVFGDGHHPSTVLCGQYLQDIDMPTPGEILDLGTGSGILAFIAKHRFPTATVTGSDIDPAAVIRATDNGTDNQLACAFYEADILSENPKTKADLIIANLPTDLQLEIAPRVSAWLTAGGRVLVSGVWETWRSAVIAAYTQAGFSLFQHTTQDGWCGFVFVLTARA